ncbi:flagellar hook-basal body complex protein [Rhizorhapis sp.]|uniref:flagellar hook-basal body complex protein n=1 Tax=Rhizorhapis sp. TaxID=1968842 RepID=UPI002B477CD2|nr:flagellar hook-basal body complex protein [Rhizorhapis sp.]HKR18109.1 flagellar hook-basal body complex protein [Rhizorhapis sp.]
MSFYISLSGLKAAQSDLTTISNNVANVSSTAFKKSRAAFGDIFSSSALQTSGTVAGQGVRLNGLTQQFTQGTLETTDKTLDLAITGEGFFTVATESGQIGYTRNGAFSLNEDRYIVDTTGSRIQALPVDASGTVTSTAAADLTDVQVPTSYTNAAGEVVDLSSLGISKTGLITATFADGTTQPLGSVALASFPSQEGLRQSGDAHWEANNDSGGAVYGTGASGLFGTIQSGALERSNVDITEELVALISAQRNFQANAKAIESASTMTQAIVNLRT